MIMTLTGANSFSLRRRLNELTQKFVSEYGEMALYKIDAEEAPLGSILDAVQSMPFLSSKKMVVLHNLGANKRATEQVEQIISSAGDTVELIIVDPQIDKRTGYFKVLKSKTKLESYDELDSRQLAVWLVNEAKNEGDELSAADAKFLVERVGPNQAMLANELNKLLVYAPKITRANIELLSEQTPQSKIFDLLDAAFSGRKKTAIRLYEEQRAQKVEPQAILAMIAWQLHLLAAVKLGAGRPLPTIAQDLSINPYPLKKAAQLADRLEDAELKGLIDDAFSIDWRGKTKSIDMDEALKTYIVTI